MFLIELQVGPPGHVDLGDPGGLFRCAGGKLVGMKLQFSLATLLVCMTVLAVVCCMCAKMQVHLDVDTVETINGKTYPLRYTDNRPPTENEFVLRLMWAAPLSIAATLGTLWAIRRLKSRCHTEPPGG